MSPLLHPRSVAAPIMALVLACSPMANAADQPASDGVYVIDAGKIVTMDNANRVLNNASVLIADGKILAVGDRAQLDIPPGAINIDATDRWLVPGLVEAHDHIAASLWDINDSVYLTNLGLHAYNAVEPDNEVIKDARAGGVTTVLVIPGSGTNLSGFGAVVKTAGRTTEEITVREPGSLKVSQAGNPEWYWYGVGRSFMNYNTRQTLEKARAYSKAAEGSLGHQQPDQPRFNPMFDDFRGVFSGEFPTLVHTQGYQVLMSTLDMVTDKLGLWTILGHCTFDAYKLAPLVDETRTYTCNGPRQYFFDRQAGTMNGNAARWWQGGIRNLSVNTDAPVVPQEELTFQAAMACWYGWHPYPALRGITRVTSETLGVDDRMGSIEVGKDADLGVWTGDPIDPRSACELTFVNGKIAYDAKVKRRF